jgi:two-component system chemotaxis response regulator CheB
MDHHDIIVMGSSAGGVTALRELVGSFPKDMPASIFIVQHVAADSESFLPDILTSAGALPAFHPKDEKIQTGRILRRPARPSHGDRK